MRSKIDVLNLGKLNNSELIKNFIIILEITMYFLSFVSFLYFIVLGIKAKALKCVIIIALLLACRLIQVITNIKLNDLLKLTILVFIFMAIFLAEILDFYSKIPVYDKVLHSLSGVMLFFVGKSLYRRIGNSQLFQRNNKIMLIFSMFFAIAMAGCWEIFEFSLDRLFGYHLQNDSLIDTMGDIICGTSTAVITCILSFIIYKVKKKKISDNCLIEEAQNELAEMAGVKK